RCADLGCPYGCNCRDSWVEDRRKNLVLRTEGRHFAVLHHGDQVDCSQRTGAMRDYDGDAATALNAFDGCGQGGLPFRLEIRVGFVEHNQEWIAIERPRKADALALAARKGCALRPEV